MKRKMKLSETRKKAFQLYLMDWTQTDIANLVGISPQTLSEWKTRDKWDENKARTQLPRITAEESIWKIINHNLSMLTARIDMMTSTGEMELISGGEIDALQRLLGRVKQDKITDAQKADVLYRFLDFMRQEDIELAKVVAPAAKKYLNSLSN